MMLVGFNSQAALIEIAVDQDTVAVGSSVSVSLIATDFGQFDLFDLDLNFSTSLFAYDNTSLQSDLPLDDGFLTLGLIGSALTDHLALSFFDSASFAGGDFLLAKFNLVALAAGVDELSISDVTFDDFIGGALIVDSSSLQELRVTESTSVPEPSSWMLLLFATLGLGVFGTRRTDK